MEGDEDVSDGSDIEVKDDLEYLLGEDNVPEEVRDQRLLNEQDNIAQNIFASDSESDEEFVRFQNAWVTNNGDFVPRNVQRYRRNRGLCRCTETSYPEIQKPWIFFVFLDTKNVGSLGRGNASVCHKTASSAPPSSLFKMASSVSRGDENVRWTVSHLVI